ncbi:MAG: glycosyltransferase family 39 protein [Bryobacteraceae bacterium]|jgi:hypothetical protein
MAVWALISAALATGIGLVLVALLAPAERWAGGRVLRLTLALPFGIGVSSAAFFWSLITGISHLEIEAVLVVVGLLVGWRIGLPAAGSSAPGGAGPAGSGDTLIGHLFLLLAAADAGVFAWWSAKFPSGGWDGWAIWNQRARFLYEAGDSWRSAFSPALHWSHTDYPLLVPATVARAWRDLGRETTLVPVLLAAGFAIAVAALLVASLGALRGRGHGLAAGALLLATPAFVRYAASQYADVELSYFILATIVLQCVAGGSPAPERWLALAGIAAGLAAWTKSEGLLWVVAAAAALAPVRTVAADGKTRLKRIGAFLAGACPFLLTVLYFRRSVVISWYFLGQNGTPQIGENLRDIHRYRMVAEAFAGQIWRFGSPLLSPVIFLAGYLLLSGIGVARRHRPGLATAGLALSLTAAGYYAIYMLTPEDPRWLLGTSLDRLCLQLWPGVLFTAVVGAGAIGRPDKA